MAPNKPAQYVLRAMEVHASAADSPMRIRSGPTAVEPHLDAKSCATGLWVSTLMCTFTTTPTNVQSHWREHNTQEDPQSGAEVPGPQLSQSCAEDQLRRMLSHCTGTRLNPYPLSRCMNLVCHAAKRTIRLSWFRVCLFKVANASDGCPQTLPTCRTVLMPGVFPYTACSPQSCKQCCDVPSSMDEVAMSHHADIPINIDAPPAARLRDLASLCKKGIAALVRCSCSQNYPCRLLAVMATSEDDVESRTSEKDRSSGEGKRLFPRARRRPDGSRRRTPGEIETRHRRQVHKGFKGKKGVKGGGKQPYGGKHKGRRADGHGQNGPTNGKGEGKGRRPPTPRMAPSRCCVTTTSSITLLDRPTISV